MAQSKLLESRLPCPSCPSSDAYHLYDDGHGYCFSCQYYYHPEKEEFDNLNFTYEYLPWRGVSKKTMEFYGVKTKIDSDGKPVEIGYLYPSGAVKVRSFADKSFRWTNGHTTDPGGLYGRDKFDA